MKQLKKLLLAVLCIALVLTGTLLVVAACGEQGYKVTTEYNNEQGTVTVSAPAEGTLFDENEQATITVEAKSGYEIASFAVSGHADAALDDNGQYQFDVTADTVVTVTFRGLFGVTVTVNPEGKANYDLSAPENLSTYHDGEKATLTVTTDPDYSIEDVKVNGASIDGENGVYEFTVTEPTTVAIELKQMRFNVTIGASQHGSVAVSAPQSGNKYSENELVTVTAEPDADYALDKVFANGTEIVKNDEDAYTFTVTEDTTVTATFTKVAFEIRTTVDPEDSATVRYSPEQDRYSEGDVVTINAEGDRFHTVSEITVNGEPLEATDGEYKFTVHGDTDVVVTTQEAGIITCHLNRENGATVTLSPQEEKYSLDAVVTVTIVANAGYEITSVKLNGEPLENYAEFTVTFSDYTENEIEIELVSPADRIIDNMQGGLHVHGVISDDDGGDYLVIDNYYDATNNRLLLQVTEYGIPDFVILAEKTDDGIYFVSHDPVTGKTERDLAAETFSWELFWNPFERMQYNDLIQSDESWSFAPVWATDLLQSLSLFNETATSSSVTIVDNKITSFKIEGSIGEYNFTVDNFGTATIPQDFLTDYTTPAELQTALQAAGNATAYSIDVTDYYGKIAYQVIVTEKAIYDQSLGGGYYERADGSVWTFAYSEQGGFVKGTQVLDASVGGIKELFAQFALQRGDNTFYHLFRDVGEGNYQLRTIDMYFGVDSTEIASAMASYFVTVGTNYADYFDEDLGFIQEWLNLTIQNGALVSAEFIGMDAEYSFVPLLLEFDFENVTLPFTIAEEDVNGNIDPEFVGTWVQDGVNFIVDIDLDTVVINGIAAARVTANDDGGYTVFCGVTTYTLTLESQAQSVALKVVDDGGNERMLRLRTCPWEKMVGIYTGTATPAEGVTDSLTLTITESGLTIRLSRDDEVYISGTVPASSFGFVDGDQTIIYFPVDQGDTGIIYVYILLLSDNQAVLVQVEDDVYSYFEIQGLAAGYDPNNYASYNGKYTGENGVDTLSITSAGITINVGGQTVTVAAKDITYDPITYTTRLFFFTAGGVDYVLKQYGATYDRLVLFVGDDETGILFERNGFKFPSWESFVGTFVGEDQDHQYKVEITKDAISFYIDDQSQSVTVTDFDQYIYEYEDETYTHLWRFEFTVGGKTYRLTQADSGIYYALFLSELNSQGAETDLATLILDQTRELDDWSQYVGEYSGEGYTVVISDDSITITPDNGQATIIAKQDIMFRGMFDYEYEEFFYQFRFTYNGKDCVIEPDNSVEYIVLALLNADGKAEQHMLTNKNYALPQDMQFAWLIKTSANSGYWAGTGTSSAQTPYALKVTRDPVSGKYTVLLKIGNADFADITNNFTFMRDLSQVYGEYEASIYITWFFNLNGKNWQLIYNLELSLSQQYYGEQCIISDGTDRAPLGMTDEPTPECQWSEFLGTWSVTDNGVVYTLVVDVDSLHITYGDVDFTVNAQTDSFRYSEGLHKWTWRGSDGKVWNIQEDNGRLDMWYDDATDFDVYLEKQAD